MNKRLFITIILGFILVLATGIAIKFAQGYRLSLKEKKIAPTGLLVANSFPKGASVFINGKLTTATDDTLNLPPADYQVKIVKDGFIPWEKNLKLEKELVTQTNAYLFPAAPDLKALTLSGASKLTPSPDGHKLAFNIASSSARMKNGLWVLDLSNSNLINRGARQICQNTEVFNFNKADFVWSPDSEQILAKTKTSAVLLYENRFNNPRDLKDVTVRLPLILADWEEQLKLEKERKWKKLPEEMQKIASSSAKNVYFSPDEEKILYTATAPVEIPKGLIPPLPASNSQKESRKLEAGKIYVYDLKEDKNFYITEANKEAGKSETDNKSDVIKRMEKIQNEYSPLKIQPLQWFPTSKHLVLVKGNKITILEYDNTNRAVVYAGLFEKSFVYPSPDASKLLILTTLNPESSRPFNIYSINLR